MAPAAGLHGRHHDDCSSLHSCHSNSAGERLVLGSPTAQHLRQRRSQTGAAGFIESEKESESSRRKAGPWHQHRAGLAAGASSRAWKQLQLLLACASWVLASSGAILINKHILVDLNFPYPSTVGSIGLVGTSIICFVTVRLLGLVQPSQRVTASFYMLHVMPTGLFLALAMQLGNTAYLYLSVAFVQMLKAFTPVATMLFGFLFKLEQPSVPLIAAVSLIAAGVATASYGEGNFSVVGVAAMLASIFCEGLRLVLMQFLVAKKSFHPLEALMYLAPAAAFWTLVIATTTEWVHIHQSLDHLYEVVEDHWGVLAGSAVAGFGVNAMAMAVVTMASALTLKVLGICKDMGLVLWGVLKMGEKVSQLQLAGYGLSIIGFAWYNVIKATQGPAKPGAVSAPRGSVSGAFTAAVEPKPPSRATLAAAAAAARS